MSIYTYGMSDKPFPTAESGEPTLFDLPPAVAPAAPPVRADPRRGVRLRQAHRSQLTWGPIDLDSQLPALALTRWKR